MARGSKRGSSTPRGGRRGRGRGGQQRGGRQNTTPASARESYFSYTHGVFSLADEARNTSQHNHWDTNSHLRNKPVTFVSAGASEPLKQLDDELLKTDGAEERNLVPPETNIKTPLEQLSEPELLAKDGHSVSTPDHEAKDESFQSDNVSTIPPQEPGNMPGSPDPDAQTPEKLASDDGKAPDGLFYFDLGRDARTSPMEQPKADIPVAHDADQEGNSSDEEVILFKGRDASAHPPDQKRPPPTVANMELKIQVVDERLAVKDDKPRAPDNNKAKSLPAGRGRKSRQRKRSDSDALLADYIANMQESGEIDQLLALDSRNTRDLGGSQDEEEILGQGATNTVQSSGTKPNATGVQTEPPSAVEIGGARSPAKDHYSSQSEADDEALAKLIAGQDLNDTLDQAWPEGSSSSTSGSDDDETGLLNQFDIDDFDVMDWERPSVRQRKKGKASRAQLTMDVSDDELEQTLQMAWKNDRLKKSQRKKQREELRALGLLGKNASKPDDPRVKYPEGMNLQQVAEEMKDFLRGGQQSLSFPPMDTHGRKMIHDLANKFNVKSKSTGKADQRRTTLYRTIRTLPYVEAPFENAVAKINRRYFPRLDIKGKRTKRPAPARSNDAAASYREGEVVGAAAPELGAENRGRAMLEKMGWSKGDALGALDNKGILQPVPQTMKKSKAGLG